MLAGAKGRHPAACIRWVQDAMPGLDEVLCLGPTFDAILLSAVWMHVSPADRPRAFRKLVSLLRPGGVLAMSLGARPNDA